MLGSHMLLLQFYLFAACAFSCITTVTLLSSYLRANHNSHNNQYVVRYNYYDHDQSSTDNSNAWSSLSKNLPQMTTPTKTQTRRTSPLAGGLGGSDSDSGSSNSLFVSWPLTLSFDWNRSTEDNYKLFWDGSKEELSAVNDVLEQSRFASIRRQLDYSFHSVYTLERQAFQDNSIIEPILLRRNRNQTVASSRQWIVFTAGVMGAGKTFSLEWLQKQNRFFPSTNDFVWVDPDALRRLLPEFDVYLQHEQTASLAGELTRKEAGLLTELLTLAALQRGWHVVVDGTLRDADWYYAYFDRLRRGFPGIQIAILHITAPPETVLERAKNRAKVTGRIVPEELLRQVMTQVPASVNILKHKVDVFVELFNGKGAESNLTVSSIKGDDDDDESDNDIIIQLVYPPEMSWDEFANLWKCPTNIGNRKIKDKETSVDKNVAEVV